MRLLAAACFGLIVAAVAIPATANPFDGGFRLFVQSQWQGPGRGQVPAPQRGADEPMPQRGADGPMPQRDTRGAPPAADRGRMSPDERRQLRRDIQDAGRDIYHPARSAPEPRRSGRR